MGNTARGRRGVRVVTPTHPVCQNQTSPMLGQGGELSSKVLWAAWQREGKGEGARFLSPSAGASVLGWGWVVKGRGQGRGGRGRRWQVGSKGAGSPGTQLAGGSKVGRLPAMFHSKVGRITNQSTHQTTTTTTNNEHQTMG